MEFFYSSLDDKILIDLYYQLLKPRLIEEKMLILLRQGKISKWFSGIGQEAISVGVTMALNEDEYILPMHRNLGVFTTRNIPLYRLFGQWQGKMSGYTKGRDRSFHFGTQKHKIIGMISHLGPQLGVADGIALGNLLKNNKQVTAVFTGEGATSEGDFHEALNIASVWKLPVLFCVENNGYGLSTPVNEQFNCHNIADKGIGYGMESRIINGNNILEVYTQVKQLADSVRENPRPVLIEFKTFRVRGHEEASGTKYVPDELMEEWKAKDPISNFQAYLLEHFIIDEKTIEGFKAKINKEIEDHLNMVSSELEVEFDLDNELNDVYKSHAFEHIPPKDASKKIRFVDAISEALDQSMSRLGNLVIMGQDIAEYGGVFKVTEGFVKKYGKSRIINTPICESGIVSTAMGLSINSMKSVVEMQFADFVSSGFNPIVNYLAKVHYRWGQQADVVVRMPCGAGVGAGPFHSQTNEVWFLKTPGLKVVYPAFPFDAKGLLATSINDPNPVLFFEHKALYRSYKQEIPESYYTLPLGEASIVKKGKELTIIAYGMSVHWAMDAMEDLDASIELIDLRTLQPLDEKTIIKSVKKTGKAIVIQEDTLFVSLASEISSLIMEHCFEYLDAPVKRIGSIETPVPFAKSLEEGYLPKSRIKKAIKKLLSY